MVDGAAAPYDGARLARMYAYQDARGELYWIEAEEEGVYRPIGDVAFWQMDLPIVIGEKRWRGRGVGRQVVAALVERGRALGYPQLYVKEIYDWNIPSRKLFTGAGFRPCEKTRCGARYRLLL